MLGKLIKSNFRKDLSHMITFFLILIISSFMLHTGFMILTGYKGLFEKSRKEFNSADIEIEIISRKEGWDLERFTTTYPQLDPDVYFKDAVSMTDTLLRSLPEVEDFERVRTNIAQMSYKTSSYNEDMVDDFATKYATLYMVKYGDWTEIEKPHFVELSDVEYDDPIYLSEWRNENTFGFELGQEIDVEIRGRSYTFHVAGFYDSIMGPGYAYVDADTMKAINEDERPLEYDFYYLRTAPGTDINELIGKITEEFGNRKIIGMSTGIDTSIDQISYMQNIIGAILIAFAVIIALVSVVVIYFRISNSIEQNVRNIGVQKALGYTAGQIRLAMILQYFLTSFVGFAAGIALSYTALPVFEKSLRSFCGIRWNVVFDPVPLLVTFAVIIGTVVLVAVWSTRKISSLNPITALRFGLEDHSFRRNYFPLESSGGNLSVLLALKSAMQNARQNIMLITLMTAIGFIASFAVVIGYNTAVKPMNLARIVNSEIADAVLYFNGDTPLSEISSIPEVKNCYYYGYSEVTVEGHSCYANTTEDFDDMDFVNVYGGRPPRYDDEIAIGGSLAEAIGIKIGDEVSVTSEGRGARYTVTGFVQGAANGGQEALFTDEGVRHLNMQMNRTEIHVVFNEPKRENAQKVIEELKQSYGTDVFSSGNYIEALEDGSQLELVMSAYVVIFVIIVSVIIVILCMSLLVKTVIIRRQREIGIKKAIGFSSGQIRTELVFSFMPQVIAGTILGSVIGTNLSNFFLTKMLNSLGIMQARLEITGWMWILAVAAVTLVTALITWFLSGKIKKISAYSLITE